MMKAMEQGYDEFNKLISHSQLCVMSTYVLAAKVVNDGRRASRSKPALHNYSHD